MWSKPLAVQVCGKWQAPGELLKLTKHHWYSNWKWCSGYQPCNPILTLYEPTFNSATGRFRAAVRNCHDFILYNPQTAYYSAGEKDNMISGMGRRHICYCIQTSLAGYLGWASCAWIKPWRVNKQSWMVLQAYPQSIPVHGPNSRAKTKLAFMDFLNLGHRWKVGFPVWNLGGDACLSYSFLIKLRHFSHFNGHHTQYILYSSRCPMQLL